MARRDGTKLKNIDSMHVIMPLVYQGRCNNEAFLSETLDLTNVMAYLEKKKGLDPDYKYNLFQVMVTAMLKTITLRPKLNYFIADKTMYERNYISAGFTVKKEFKDDGDESLAVIKAKPDDTIDTIHEAIRKRVKERKDPNITDGATDFMDSLKNLPGPILKIIGSIFCWLDQKGLVPKSITDDYIFMNSVVVANIGSIGLGAGLHHLVEFGTTSLFLVIGEMKKRPFWDEEGNMTMKQSVDISLTIDERIVDGFYYAKSIRLFKKLIECPELLDRPLSEEVEF